MPATTKQIKKVFAMLPKAYFLYKGTYEGIEIRIEGTQHDFGYGSKKTQLWVRAYWGEHVMNSYTSPFGSMATARKYAKEMLTSLVRMTASAERDNWPVRCDYSSHMPIYRNYNADRGRVYFDYRRKAGPVIQPDFPTHYDQHVQDFYRPASRRLAA